MNSIKKSLPRFALLGHTELQKNILILRSRFIVVKDVARNITKSSIIALVMLSSGIAKDSPELNIQIEDHKLNITEAEQIDSTSISYAPGDTIQYVITATNVGSAIMTNPVIVDPIPAGVTYVGNSAKGGMSEISFSLDQGNTYMAWPPIYTVRNSKGLLVRREAIPDMITHIKWNINSVLKPEESSMLEFLVVVNK
ncbi:MAG: DUF11 domain-containing protein [Candidatus Marinimicrobia bacterium]|nr:DUF11 domain-containing protein [Candidatus Neomarinimicrobiota bacterium]